MASSETLKIRFGGYQPPASVHSRAVLDFAASLRQSLGDEVTFEFQCDITEAGRNAAELLASVENGSLEMCYFASSYLAGRVPCLELLDLPFAVDNREMAYLSLDGELGSRIAGQLDAATGFRLLGYWDNGFRHVSNARHPIRSPADCRGLRIRTLSSALHGKVFSALGFEPVVLDVRELRRAVADGSVDAQENPLTTFELFGLHRYHRHLTLSAHFFGTVLLLCNAAAYAGWPARVRRAVDAAAAAATEAQRRYAAAEDDRVLAVLRQAGTEVIALTSEERHAFVAAVEPIRAELRKKHGTDQPGPLS
jgi:TRAP-type C4-dicarboxylate transport system substrate-binding protein